MRIVIILGLGATLLACGSPQRQQRQQRTVAKSPVPTIRSRLAHKRYDGKRVHLVGQYRAVIMPSKRGTHPSMPGEYAVIELADKTLVYLERYNTPLARRSLAERTYYNGRQVRVRGTLHLVCPAVLQAPSVPCLTAIKRISIVSP